MRCLGDVEDPGQPKRPVLQAPVTHRQPVFGLSKRRAPVTRGQGTRSVRLGHTSDRGPPSARPFTRTPVLQEHRPMEGEQQQHVHFAAAHRFINATVQLKTRCALREMK